MKPIWILVLAILGACATRYEPVSYKPRRVKFHVPAGDPNAGMCWYGKDSMGCR